MATIRFKYGMSGYGDARPSHDFEDQELGVGSGSTISGYCSTSGESVVPAHNNELRGYGEINCHGSGGGKDDCITMHTDTRGFGYGTVIGRGGADCTGLN